LPGQPELPGRPELQAGPGLPAAEELPERLAARALEPLPGQAAHLELPEPRALPNQAASAPRRAPALLVARRVGPGPVALPERQALDEHPLAGASLPAAYRGAGAAEEVPSHRPVRHRE